MEWESKHFFPAKREIAEQDCIVVYPFQAETKGFEQEVSQRVNGLYSVSM